MANSRRNEQCILFHAYNAASASPKIQDAEYLNFSRLASTMFKLVVFGACIAPLAQVHEAFSPRARAEPLI